MAAGPPPRAMLPPRPWKSVRPRLALLAHAGDRFLRLEERPVRGQVAAILVAVRVAEHDLLVIAADCADARGTARSRTSGCRIPGAASRSPSVSNSGAMSSEHADEMLEDHHLDDVGKIVRHADDVDAHRLGAEEFDGALEHPQRADDVARLRREASRQLRRGRGENLAHQREPFLLGKLRRNRTSDVSALEHFRHRRLVAHRVLAHVEPRHAQAEERHLLAQPVQFALGQKGAAMRARGCR